MGSLENMVRAMLPIGAYSLNKWDLVYKELETYSRSFDEIGAAVDELIRERFITTAEGEGLERYERIIGPVRDDLETELRREMLKALFTVGENDFTLDGLHRFLDSLGFECSVVEDPSDFHLLMIPQGREYSPAEQELIRERVGEFIPCHLTYTIEFRSADWDEYDSLSKTFDDWDALDLCWDDIDKYEED